MEGQGSGDRLPLFLTNSLEKLSGASLLESDPSAFSLAGSLRVPSSGSVRPSAPCFLTHKISVVTVPASLAGVLCR